MNDPTGHLDAVPLMDTTLTPLLPDPFPGEYRFRRELGAGGYGTVWLADDLGLGGRPVAIKTLRPALPADKMAVALAALQHEAGLLGQLNHPNVAQVHALRRAGDAHYLVMRYVDGGALADRVEGGPLPWASAVRYAADVGEGLAAAHALGVVHRDVKPANVLWDRAADEAVLTDFGVAARLADPGVPAGTSPYMAPEALSADPTPAFDVYGLAATLFHLVAGEPPFGVAAIKVVAARALVGLPPTDGRLAGVPENIDRLIRAGLTADPNKRPALAEFVARLRGELNQALADTLPAPAAAGLRVHVARPGPNGFSEPLALSAKPVVVFRDLKRVPAPPPAARLRTGDRVRVEVVSDRPGYVTVFNIGPSGNLNLLCPAAPGRPGEWVPAGRPLLVADAELTPPAGSERVFAVWTARPVSLAPDETPVTEGVSQAYAATRELERVTTAFAALPAADRAAVVVELDHGPTSA